MDKISNNLPLITEVTKEELKSRLSTLNLRAQTLYFKLSYDIFMFSLMHQKIIFFFYREKQVTPRKHPLKLTDGILFYLIIFIALIDKLKKKFCIRTQNYIINC